VAAFGTLPSLYTGRLWGHIDAIVVRGGGGPVAGPLIGGAVRSLTAVGAVDTSVALPEGQEAVERASRAHGYGDEELRLFVLVEPSMVPMARHRGDVEVRAASSRDAGMIAALIRLFADEYGEPSAADAASVLRYLRTGRVGALVASLGHEPAGLLAFSTSYHPSFGRCTTVDDLVVSRTARRRGVASALLDQALGRARAAGAARAHLWLQPGNGAAEALYRSRGFRESGKVLVRHAGSPPVQR